jgi:hypothetical protein
MRGLLILGGIGILSAAAWSVTAGEGASGQRSAHGASGHGGLEGHVRHGGGHAGHTGMFWPTQQEARPRLLFAGESEPRIAALGMPTGGLMVGGAEHVIEGHLVGPAIHPHAHVVVRVEWEEAVIPQPPAPIAVESDQAGAATAQPNPLTASPLQPRPPGAAGPGRPVSGWSSPGLPGPGRPASSRW